MWLCVIYENLMVNEYIGDHPKKININQSYTPQIVFRSMV